MAKLGGAYLVGVGAAVAGFFVVNPFVAEAGVDTIPVWLTLDVLMAVALPIALVFSFRRKQAEGKRLGEPGDARRYVGANVLFYTLAAITILFYHSWFSLLAAGTGSLGDPADAASANHQAWVLWGVVDVVLPLALGAAGAAMWRSADSD